MIYNYLISDYVNQEHFKNYSTVRKKSDLKKIYSDIVKISKDSPSYIVNPTEETQAFAIQLKEGSMSLQETLEQLQNGGLSSAFSYKEVLNDNTKAISTVIDTDDHSKLPEDFSIQIDSLATGQVNNGVFVNADANRMNIGEYVFRLDTEDESYDFNISVTKSSTNESTLRAISSMLNKSPADIFSKVEFDKKHEKLKLNISSSQTGSPDGNPLFQLSDVSHSKGHRGIVATYQLDQIEQMPANSSFRINGEEKSTLANEFTLNNSLHVTMKKTTFNPINVHFVSDSKKILSEMDVLQDTYNGLVQLSYGQNNDPSKLATHMLHDLKDLFSTAKDELAQCGISFDDKGFMHVDKEQARISAQAGKFQDIFGENSNLSSRVINQSKMFSMDPMKYIEDKIMVSYPNPTKEHVANPYMTSIYSGMLFNSYC